MIKRFCDRCGTELSKNDYVHLNMNGYGLNKHNSKYSSKDVQLCHECAKLILETLKRY